MRRKCIYQSQAKGCGYAAIKMALIHSSGRKDFAYAEEPPIASRAPSVADLVIYAEHFGLTLLAYRVADPRELEKNTEFPLLLVIRENRLTHMVYLLKRTRRYYYVLDPAKGRRRFTHEELHAAFTGAFLCERDYVDKTPTIKAPKALPTHFKVLDAILSVAPTLLLVSGLFALEEAPLFVGMGLVGLSVIALGAEKVLKLRFFKHFDRLYGHKLLSPDEEKRVELYTHFCAYKGLAFTSVGALLTSFLEMGIVTAMFVCRDLQNGNAPYFGLAVSLALLLGIVVHILDEPREKAAMESSEEKERHFLHATLGPKKREMALLSLFASSSSLAGIMLAKEAFFLGISVVLSAISMILTGCVDFVFFVYYALGIAFILHALNGCFAAVERMECKRKEEPYFLFHFVREDTRNE